MPVCRVYDAAGKELSQCSTDAFLPFAKIFFGRSSQCDVSLKAVADSNISRQHFYVQESMTKQWGIYDNDSRAGIILNGHKVKSADLYDGTVIRFGQLFFTFGDKGVPSHFRLTWTDRNGQIQRAYLWEGVNTIGASHDNYVTIREGNVSRFHCNIVVHGNEVELRQTNSMLDLDVNGEPISQGSAALKSGDTFTMSGFPVEIEWVDAVTKRALVVRSPEEIAKREKNFKTVKNNNLLIKYCFLGTAVLFLIALALWMLSLIPGIR